MEISCSGYKLTVSFPERGGGREIKKWSGIKISDGELDGYHQENQPLCSLHILIIEENVAVMKDNVFCTNSASKNGMHRADMFAPLSRA